MNFHDSFRDPARSQGQTGTVASRHVPAAVAVYLGQYRGRVLFDYADDRGHQRQCANRIWIWRRSAILFAIPFDALDGRIARMTNTCSDFGKELDSLADVITFGVAPSLLAFVWGFHFLPDSINPELRQHLLQAGAFICFLFLLSGASRLARFNICHDAQPQNPGRPGRKYFVGMPIPAAAGLLASTVHLVLRHSGSGLVGRDSLAADGGLVRIPDGEHVAVLVGQGDQLLAQPSVSGAGAAGDRDVCHDPLFECGDVRDWAHVYVFGHLGPGGVWMVAAAPAKTDVEGRLPSRMPRRKKTLKSGTRCAISRTAISGSISIR